MRKLSVIQTSPKRTMTPIIKVVGDFCNLRCAYCFYNTLDQQTPHVMSEEMLESFVRQYLELFDGNVQFIWHGGEPLLAGLRFFEKIVEFQSKHRSADHRISNVVQTNATLVTDEWARFFSNNKFGVGVSIDGDKISHDRFRTRCGGQGSFDLVMRGIAKLREFGVEPGFIHTVTASSLESVEQDFAFFADGLKAKSWGLNDYLDVINLNKRMLNQTLGNAELTAYMKKYVDLWLSADRADLRVRDIENFLAGISGRCASNCAFNGTCSSYFTVEYDGRVYPCDRLSNRSELLYGDIGDQTLAEVLNGQKRMEFADAVNQLHPDCAQCEWQKACHNGCSHHRKGGLSGKFYFCETRKQIFAHLKEKVAQMTQQQEEGTHGNGADSTFAARQ